EAIGLLQEHGDEAKLLAGGHSLLPAMKLRLAQPGVLIDITKIDSLRGIAVNGDVKMGAMATYSAITEHAELRAACGVLAEVCAQIGDIQVRNRGTIGGSLAHSDPAADLPALALALDAMMTVQGPNGSREIAAGDMFVEMLTTALEPDEVMTAVTMPRLGAGEGAVYEKLRNPASRYAIVGVAAYVKIDGGMVSAARVAVTGAGVKAVRQPTLEAALVGSDGGADAIASAAEQAGEDVDFLGDIHASEDYRRAMVKIYARRALVRAVAQAQG
ncbi:MAG: xanthine dehydrogenase family protein subunit M, partial [Roseiflexaceae bacterium]|nr:xanthine dehydrogenase family protein subunit M [Roseiflexaceae bacterium]